MNHRSAARVFGALLIMTSLLLAACAGKPNPVALNTVACTVDYSTICPAGRKCGGAAAREVEVCVNFVQARSDWCIDTANPVTPASDVCVCRDDTLKWKAVDSGGNPIDEKFSVWFLPLNNQKFLSARRPQNESPDSVQSRALFASLPDDGVTTQAFKYTIVGGDAGCGTQIFDPRIRVDPD